LTSEEYESNAAPVETENDSYSNKGKKEEIGKKAKKGKKNLEETEYD